MWIKNQRHGLKQILTNVLIGHFTKGKMRSEMWRVQSNFQCL